MFMTQKDSAPPQIPTQLSEHQALLSLVNFQHQMEEAETQGLGGKLRDVYSPGTKLQEEAGG